MGELAGVGTDGGARSRKPPYECTHLPNAPSEGGDVKGPVRQLRDPGLFEEGGRTYLFYSFCGEQGIAAAELTFSESP